MKLLTIKTKGKNQVSINPLFISMAQESDCKKKVAVWMVGSNESIIIDTEYKDFYKRWLDVLNV